MKKLLLLLAAVGMIFTACQSGGDVEEDNGGTPFVPEIIISLDELSFPVEGGEQEVAITANFEYKVSEKADWLSVEQTETGLLVKVDKSERVESRYADIVLTNKEYEVEKFISVSQAAFEPSIAIKPSAITFSANGGEQEVIITSNIEYEVSKRASWLSVEQTDTGLVIVANESKNSSERTAYISIINEKYSITKTIDIIQEAYVPKIELAQQSIEVEFEPAEYEVAVTSPYSWEATTKNDWIVVESKTSIAGEEKLKFTTLRNEEEKERKGTITLKNTDYNLAAELYIIQKAFVPSKITLEPENLTFAAEGGAQDVTITANFGYEVTASVGWVTYEKTDNGIKVTVPTYTEVEERTAEVVVASEKYGVSRSIKVTQEAFVPSEIILEPENLTFAAEGDTQEVVITANFNYYDVTTTADWITYKKTNSGVAITASANPTTEQRSADVIIYNDNYHLSAILTVTQEGRAKIPNNEIWYTSSDGLIVEPYKTDVFGANIVSNTYANGKGVIVFDVPVTSIGGMAFYECTPLTSITIPDRVDSIGQFAFGGCRLLMSITIPDSVTSIGEAAFINCTSLTGVTIPNSVTLIEDSAFIGCTSLTSITIPDSVTSIGHRVFQRCTSLKAFYGKYASSDNRCLIVNNSIIAYANASGDTYSIPNSIISIGDYTFANCTSLTSVTITDSVTSIGSYAFNSCGSLTGITIPNSVMEIGYGAFKNCTSLTSVAMPDSITSIEGEVFYACSKLTNITIPDCVTSIGKEAFYYCNALTNITIPDGVTLIGVGAFYKCHSLRIVYCKPTTPPSGGSSMFSNNASSRKIYVPINSVEAYKSAEYWSDYASDIVGYDF